MWSRPDHLVVGAGFFGAVVAERLAAHGRKVLVIESRHHLGGNSWSTCEPETGIEYHPYGIHVFHTSNLHVKNYIDEFARLNDYRHQVVAQVKDRLFPFPINLETINSFFGKNFSPREAINFIGQMAAQGAIGAPRNLEEKAISLIGKELYEAFILGYTKKQWGIDPKHLPANIFTRLPLRFDSSRDYFQRCRWQGIPLEGYAVLFSRILNHKNIRVETGVDFSEVKDLVKPCRETIYTGAIDQYFSYAFGSLGWRSVSFQMERKAIATYQETASVNYPDIDIPFTRIHEPKHLHPERGRYHNMEETLVIREFPDKKPLAPYYPVRCPEDLAMLKQYQAFSAKEVPDTIFGGRLGRYAYLDMDMTVASALACARTLLS